MITRLRIIINSWVILMLIMICNQQICYAKTIYFSDIKWQVKDDYGSPGPNYWSSDNAWVDNKGWLHLKISYKDGKWFSAGVSTDKPLWFGKYWFYVISHADRLEPNITLALFNYPTPDVGPDETNEIDIEFFKRDQEFSHSLNTAYIVWPPELSKGRTSMTFRQDYHDTLFTHGFIWKPREVRFYSSTGHSSDYENLISSWIFSPPDYEKRIPQKALPIYIYFYIFQGKTLGLEKKNYEIIIKKFCYEADIDKKSNCIGEPI